MSGYYTREAATDTVVTIYKPITSNFISGGGYLTLSSSNGLYAGDAGSKNNFGFNVKYNSTGKNLQGNFNSIIRQGTKTYQVKANAMDSLVVTPATGCPNATAASPCMAVFTSKANMTDITDPLNPISLGGNLVLQVSMTDKGEPGNGDSIAITVSSTLGGVLYSSSWNGTRTVEQTLAPGSGNGNLVVH